MRRILACEETGSGARVGSSKTAAAGKALFGFAAPPARAFCPLDPDTFGGCPRLLSRLGRFAKIASSFVPSCEADDERCMDCGANAHDRGFRHSQGLRPG